MPIKIEKYNFNEMKPFYMYLKPKVNTKYQLF